MSPPGELPGSSPPFTSLKLRPICNICAKWPLTAETRALWRRYTCCDTGKALTLTSVIMKPVKAIMTNCTFSEGSQKHALVHQCSGFRERSQSLCAVSFLFSPRARLSQLPSRSASRLTTTTVIWWYHGAGMGILSTFLKEKDDPFNLSKAWLLDRRPNQSIISARS